MARIARDERYSTVAIWFHWTVALLVIVNIVVGIGHEYVAAIRPWMAGHKAIGITVLVLSLGRVAWRLVHRPPPLPADVRGWERGAAHAAHWALYALLIVMPVTGWVMSGGSRPYPFTWFGLFNVPLIPASDTAAGVSHQVHVVLGWGMAALVIVHIAAALRHHLIRRDAVLARMAPGLSLPAGAPGTA